MSVLFNVYFFPILGLVNFVINFCVRVRVFFFSVFDILNLVGACKFCLF